MGYNVYLQAEAILEMDNAFEWYEEQREGLGHELIEEIESCFEYLRVNHPT